MRLYLEPSPHVDWYEDAQWLLTVTQSPLPGRSAEQGDILLWKLTVKGSQRQFTFGDGACLMKQLTH